MKNDRPGHLADSTRRYAVEHESYHQRMEGVPEADRFVGGRENDLPAERAQQETQHHDRRRRNHPEVLNGFQVGEQLLERNISKGQIKGCNRYRNSCGQRDGTFFHGAFPDSFVIGKDFSRFDDVGSNLAFEFFDG